MNCRHCGKVCKKIFCNMECYSLYRKIPENNNMFGKNHNNSTKLKQSKKRKKIYHKLCSICKKPLKERQKYFCSQNCRSVGLKGKNNHFYGKHHKKSTIERNRLKHLGKKDSPETLKKKRIAAIAYRKRLNPGWHPNYNKKACDYFRYFDLKNNTTGQHAESGGEYYIEDLGYYLDYINFNKKLIIEFDERRHYISGRLKERDKLREKEIKKYFKDFEFQRIREKEAVASLFFS